ncbi:phospho-sugar glycosidase domain-containing protein [uncultured Dubosiella sp.]
MQIVLKPMKNDGQRNLLGHVDASEEEIFDLIEALDFFTFVKAE